MKGIKRSIQDLGLKQRWLAIRLAVHPVTLNYWIQGTRPIPDEKKKELVAIITKIKNAT